MTVIHNGRLAQWFVGDCRESLRQLAASGLRARTCVTSPPYFGLRDYGHAGQIGLDGTPDAYIAAMVEVFRCVRDVLADDGTLWLNIGDSYAASRSYQVSDNKNKPAGPTGHSGRAVPPPGCKPKDLIGIPWMLAFALRADGWYLRQDIIWHKPNPMPESVRDRCTKAHEYLFLLSKSERYYFDSEAMQEPCVSSEKDLARARVTGRGEQAASAAYLGSAQQDKSGGFPTRGRAGKNAFRGHGHHRESESGPANREGRDMRDVGDGDTRNRRSVWSVATRPFKGAHFATYPPALIEPCILAGSAPGDFVLDPFGGSGTTAGVALKHGRHALLCELNDEYVKLMPGRIRAICS